MTKHGSIIEELQRERANIDQLLADLEVAKSASMRWAAPRPLTQPNMWMASGKPRTRSTKQLRTKEHGYLKLVIHDGRAAVTQDVPVSLISHPLGPGEIRLIRSAGTLRLAFRIDAQYDLRYLSLVCALCVRFQHAHVGDGVLPVIRVKV
ncbi:MULTISPECIES: hypothetical protein [Bradyrhizobium]|uniref:Uncharacterized protein n=1 Tax=Bradyrhizobium septentrionale TaxID=1404411 RepID=A0A973VWI9_9BRAD|nr:hypothetical protein G6P99_38520 [Bradyrhizobium sp. 6(2017)]